MKKQYVYAAISIALWSTTATITKLLLGSMDSFQVLAASSGIAFAFLLLINLVKGKLQLFRTYARKDLAIMFGMGLLGIFLYHLLWYIGIDCMMASQAMIINYLWPMMVVLSACVVLKEKLTGRKLMAILISFAGVAVVTSNGQLGGFTDNTLTGAVLCVFAAMSYGLFVTLDKFLRYDKLFAMMMYYFASFVVSAAFVYATGGNLAMDLPQTLGMLWIGLFTCAIAFVTWALAMKDGNTVKISNLAYITPFLSLIWTFFLLGEPVSVYSLLGLGLIIAGIFVQMKNA